MINTHEKLRWFCMYYLNTPCTYVKNNIYNKNYPDHRFDVTYNIEYLTYKTNKQTFILTDTDVNNLLSRIDNSTISYVMLSIIFPINKYRSELIESYTGKKIYPINTTELLEFASVDFCMKHHHVFCTALIKNDDKNFIIKNTFNDCQCIIPVNIFKIYCKFSNLLHDYDINEITIPIEFTEKSSKYLENCLMNGSVQVLPKDFSIIEYRSFKSMFSYLGIEI
jgi:hypothetical protein